MATKPGLLDRAKSKAAEKPAAKKNEIRVVVVPETLHQKIRELCELANISDEVTPLVVQRKSAISDEFFALWTAEMWANRNQPENFKVVLKALDSKGAVTPLDDVACNFILKFNTNGLSKRMPDKKGSDKTVEEIIIEMLVSGAVGLTEAKAKEFVQAEVEIQDKVTLAKSFDEMYSEPEGTALHAIAVKMLTYAQARTTAKSGKVTLEAWTDEEESMAFVTEQIISLKAGLGNRVFTYCEGVDDTDTSKNGLERLRKLLNFLNVTKQVSNFEFGISDEAVKRAQRMEVAVGRYLLPATT